MSRRRKRRIGLALVVLLALLALVASAALTSAKTLSSLSHPCGGHERWTVKVLIDGDADQVNVTPMHRAINTLRKLQRPSGFLGSKPRQRPVEFTTYQVRRAFLVEAKTERDDDIHLVIRDTLERTMIAEFPDPVCLDTAGSAKIAAMTSARQAFIAACGMPSRSRFVALEGRATIDGVGFFDVDHATPQRGVAPNNIELHPVLRYRSFGCRRA